MFIGLHSVSVVAIFVISKYCMRENHSLFVCGFMHAVVAIIGTNAYTPEFQEWIRSLPHAPLEDALPSGGLPFLAETKSSGGSLGDLFGEFSLEQMVGVSSSSALFVLMFVLIGMAR